MAQVVQLFVYHYTDIQKLTLEFRHVFCRMFSRSLTSCIVILSILDEFPGSGLICSCSTTFELVAL